jgi:hypothetical protein
LVLAAGTTRGWSPPATAPGASGKSSFTALDPAAEAELSRRWVGMLPTVLGNLKTLIEQR